MPSSDEKYKLPHTWDVGHDAHALLAHLRDNRGALAKKHDLKEVTGKTRGDQLFVMLIKKFLSLEVERVAEEPDSESGNPGSNAYNKSMFALKARSGRPATSAEAKLEKRRNRRGKKSQQKQKRNRRSQLPKGQRKGTFTSRGNKVIGCTETALVQVRARPRPRTEADRRSPFFPTSLGFAWFTVNSYFPLQVTQLNDYIGTNLVCKACGGKVRLDFRNSCQVRKHVSIHIQCGALRSIYMSCPTYLMHPSAGGRRGPMAHALHRPLPPANLPHQRIPAWGRLCAQLQEQPCGRHVRSAEHSVQRLPA